MADTAEFNLPVVTLLAGNAGGIFTLPPLALSSGSSGGEFALPAVTLSANGTIQIGSSAFLLPFITLSAEGLTGDAGSAEFSLPVLTIEIVAHQNGMGDAAFSLPSLALVSNGETGGLGTAAFNLPVLTVVLAANQSIVGTAAFNLPVLFLDAQGAYTLAEAYRTWVLNTRKVALTEYGPEFAFNSYAVFNGVVLGCGPGGVVTLGTQALDGTAVIVARARTGLSDFGSSFHKRVPRVYLDGAQSGDLHFKSITVEGGTRTYALLSNNITGHQQRRIGVGKGPRSRFFQFEITNPDGADFSATSIMAYPTALRRRVS